MHWGKFIRLVPHPVMLGFVNGLAIVIFLAQLTQFKDPSSGGALNTWPAPRSKYMMLGLVALTMAIIWGMPKITSVIPAPLAGIGIVAIMVIAFGLDVPRVGDMASIEGGLPSFHIPMVPLNFETFEIILPYAVILAAIGLIESLLTLNLVGEITGKRGGASQECIAQGGLQRGDRLLRRHGRLRDDRPVDDQREIRRPHADRGHRRGAVPADVHRRRLAAD